MVAAATLSFGDGGFFRVGITGGTATITAVTWSTVKSGRIARVRFGGNAAGSTIVNSGTLVLVSNANIVVAAGDEATFVCFGSTTFCTSYQRFSGRPVTDTPNEIVDLIPISSGDFNSIPTGFQQFWGNSTNSPLPGAVTTGIQTTRAAGGRATQVAWGEYDPPRQWLRNMVSPAVWSAWFETVIFGHSQTAGVTDANSIPAGFQLVPIIPPYTNAPWPVISHVMQLSRGTQKIQMAFDSTSSMGGLDTARVAIREMGNDGVWSNWVNLVTENGQIAFPATQNSSAGANTLDDYEEGAYTPALTFGGASVGITMSSAVGSYTKIGRQVNFTAHCVLTSKGTSTGVAQISLPLTPTAHAHSASIFIGPGSATLGDTHLSVRPNSSAATASLFKQAAGTVTQLTEADFTATTQFIISGHFITA
jgi:hypothetical protein